jgi:hypothetical protein
MTRLRRAIETYIQAKDGNRPHLMAEAFAPDAALLMHVHTTSISFPSDVKGGDAISAVLVSQFAQRYENVYTFCMGAPPSVEDTFDCDWLVCMTEKDTGAVRVGFGRYEWRCADKSGAISALGITIEEMASLPKESSNEILGWARRLPYPWCPPALLAEHAPSIPVVDRIVRALN